MPNTITHPTFGTLSFRLKRLQVTDSPDTPAPTTYLANGFGLADNGSKSPDLIACACTTMPVPLAYCWVNGKNASGEYIYTRRLQFVDTNGGYQWFQWQK